MLSVEATRFQPGLCVKEDLEKRVKTLRGIRGKGRPVNKESCPQAFLAGTKMEHHLCTSNPDDWRSRSMIGIHVLKARGIVKIDGIHTTLLSISLFWTQLRESSCDLPDEHFMTICGSVYVLTSLA